jgi:hypothetical protein
MDVRTVSALEQVLAQFWDATLERDASDRLTDFFSAGGGDVAAARLLSCIERTFGVSMPLTSLRQAPTVAGFAEVLKHQVDHPGRLERLAERLLHDAHRSPAAERGGQGAGASW